MKVLFLGDIVGRPGRTLVYAQARQLLAQWGADFLIANAENAAGGFGLTAVIAEELFAAGVDGITLGNHAWDQRGFEKDIARLERVCRPLNFPPGTPGLPYLVLGNKGFRLCVATVLGRTFMDPIAHCPFTTVDVLLEQLSDTIDACFIEIHAEATAEKSALGHYLDGRVAAVVGTHTHVATADAQILPRGTAFVSDVGMCGVQPSVLGFSPENAIARMLQATPKRLVVANGASQLNYVVVDINPENGLARSIYHATSDFNKGENA